MLGNGRLLLGHVTECRGEIARTGSASTDGGGGFGARSTVKLLFERTGIILLLDVKAFVVVGIAVINDHQGLVSDATSSETFLFVFG
jgi:hypothetical protein